MVPKLAVPDGPDAVAALVGLDAKSALEATFAQS